MRHALFASFALLAAASTAPAQLALQLATGFDGGISVPTDPLLVPPTGITVEAWITYDDSTIPINGLFYWPTIARQNLGSGQEVYNLRVSASNNASRTLQWIVRTGSTLVSVTYPFTAGEFANWTHVAATFDGQTLRLFKNGVQVATRALSTLTELVYAGDVLRIGNGDVAAPGRETWNGKIDELRIWPVARTAGEILSTKDLALGQLPGKLLNFTLDGFEFDVSSGLIGTTFGATTYVAGAPGVVGSYPAVTAIGQSTTNCGRAIDAMTTTIPSIGNSEFALWAVRGPLPAAAPIGLIFGSVNPAPNGFPPVLGVNVAFDLNAVIYQLALVPATSLLGNARWPLPIPNDSAFPGVSLVFQWAFLDSACGPQGITASDGLQFTFQ